ncbi:MAG: adenosylcobinamide-GDP ribazoletransferase [Gorillibacterium sp.]|nr:adenosylcobinamide-GDP ribazoletransferase [Gorillibacterium sp.]
MVEWTRSAVAAVQFLTRLPLPYRFEYTETIFRRSTPFYPLVGGIIGLLLALVTLPLQYLLSAQPAAAVILSLWIALTGALHMDGLMDSADGLLSHRSRERMLEIMKDSRVGAMGVIVAVLVLLMKFSLLFALLNDVLVKRPEAVLWLVLIPVWSRWFMTAAIAHWPYARGETGLGAYFQKVRGRHVAVGWVMACVITWVVTAVIPHAANWPIIQQFATTPSNFDLLSISAESGFSCSLGFIVGTPVIFTLLTMLVGWPLARRMNKKLGGLTGDTYGAINEVLELFLLAVIVVACRFF